MYSLNSSSGSSKSGAMLVNQLLQPRLGFVHGDGYWHGKPSLVIQD
jgi:hypothetical protein